jgi:hypothetical protein
MKMFHFYSLFVSLVLGSSLLFDFLIIRKNNKKITAPTMTPAPTAIPATDPSLNPLFSESESFGSKKLLLHS